MNSVPMCTAGYTDTPRATTASRIVRIFALSTKRMIGRYSQISARLIGFLCSGMIRPRTNSTISAGTSVIDRSAAAAMEKVLVKASGLNIRPSCASSVKIGRNETVMISSEKNSAGPTSIAASTSALTRGVSGAARSRCL